MTRFWDEVLAETAGREPQRPAFVDASAGLAAPARVVTYAELERAAAGWAGTLEGWGVGRGDVVCLLLANSPEYPACFAGNARAGAITSGVNIRLGLAETAAVIRRTHPAVTVAEDTTTVPPDVAAHAGRIVPRADLAAHFEGGPQEGTPVRDPEDLAAIVWTSGTTGVPKGACYTHVALDAVAAADTVLTRRHDVYLAAVPQAHVAFTTKVLANAERATTEVVPPQRWDAATALALMERHAVKVAGGVPPQWRMMLDHPRFGSTDLSELRQVILGGAFIESDLVREIRERLDVPVVARYTCTELAGTCGTVPGDPDEVVANTVGRPLPGVAIRLVDEAGTPVGPGVVGEVCSRSPTMMTGYWTAGGEVATGSFDGDGFFRTGDLGRLRDDGNLEIVGRRKEMYVRGGYNVYPVEVENRLALHPGVAQCAVVGDRDSRLGEVGVAFVVPADPHTPPTLDELRRWVAAALADYKRPDRVEVIEALPLTSMHKPDKAALARTLADKADR